jgi:hypothetical protein
MKKTILLLVAAFTMTSAMAQDNQGERKEGMRPDRTEMMVKEYGLNETQAAKLKELNDKYPELQRFGGRGRRGHRPMMGGPRGQMDGNTGASAQQRPERPSREDMEKMMNERRQKQEAYDKELKGIMTEDQFNAYQKKREEMRNRFPRRQ